MSADGVMGKDEIEARLAEVLKCCGRPFCHFLQVDDVVRRGHHSDCPAVRFPAVRALLVSVAQAQRETDVDALRDSGQDQAATSIESWPLVTGEES